MLYSFSLSYKIFALCNFFGEKRLKFHSEGIFLQFNQPEVVSTCCTSQSCEEMVHDGLHAIIGPDSFTTRKLGDYCRKFLRKIFGCYSHSKYRSGIFN